MYAADLGAPSIHCATRMEFWVAPPAMYSTSKFLTMSSYIGACFSSARTALLSLRSYLSRNSVGTTAEMSRRGLPMPRRTA